MPHIPSETLNHARILHRLMPHESKSARVARSAEHAERRGYANATANAEQRIGAHILRIERLFGRGSEVEARVWNRAIDELIVRYDDVPESYWQTKNQEYRDDGLGFDEYPIERRQGMVAKQRLAQRQGLKRWAHHLQSAEDQYPVWYQYYVWDGMTKLGMYNPEKGCFERRSKGSLTEYPPLDPVVVKAMYDELVDELSSERTNNGAGSFNKRYSAALQAERDIVATPDRPEVVDGEWVRYSKGDAESLAEASVCTPWCIANKDVARDFFSESDIFYLFHLRDPSTGKLSRTASASIRLDGSSGVVDEVSGLAGLANQTVERALISRVDEHVKELPGGYHYLLAQSHKALLMSMDAKMQSEQPFSIEELKLLYEIEGPIAYMYSSTHKDSRIEEFKQHRYIHQEQLRSEYGDLAVIYTASSEDLTTIAAQLLDRPDLYSQAEIDAIVARVDELYLARRVPKFLAVGAQPVSVLMRLPVLDISANPSIFVDYGVSPRDLIIFLNPEGVVNNLAYLKSAGLQADDLQNYIDQLSPRYYVGYIQDFVESGVQIDPDKLMSGLSGAHIEAYLCDLLNSNIDANLLAKRLKPSALARCYAELVQAGAAIDIDQIASQLEYFDVLSSLDDLLEAGANTNELAARINFSGVHEPLSVVQKFIQAGLDVDKFVRRLNRKDLELMADFLIDYVSDTRIVHNQLRHVKYGSRRW